MAVRVTNLYCIKNDCYKNNAKLGTVQYLIVHSPAVYPTIIRAQSGAGGGWYKRWNRPGVEKLTHGCIDDTGVFDFAPYTMAVWQVGNAYGNNHCIGYELCELSGAMEFHKVWNNAVEHYGDLCRRFQLTADRVIGHYEAHDLGIASNHSDPEPYFRRFGKSMKDFRYAVQKYLEGDDAENGDSEGGLQVVKEYEPWAYGTVVGLTKSDPRLNVRSGPDADAGVIRQLGNGNEVDVLSVYSNDWAKVNIVGQKGYVYGGYLSIAERKEAYQEWVGEAYNLGGTYLRVRTGPGTNYGVLGAWDKLWEENRAAVMGESGNWYHIRIAGKQEGWVSKDYFRKI